MPSSAQNGRLIWEELPYGAEDTPYGTEGPHSELQTTLPYARLGDSVDGGVPWEGERLSTQELAHGSDLDGGYGVAAVGALDVPGFRGPLLDPGSGGHERDQEAHRRVIGLHDRFQVLDVAKAKCQADHPLNAAANETTHVARSAGLGESLR